MTKYSKEFKEEALKLSDEIGNKKAASQLGIPYYTLADRRNKSKHKPKGTDLSNTELRIRNCELEREVSELRRANEILKDALGFLQKTGRVKTRERHIFVESFKGKYSAKEMCKVLKISESGYYISATTTSPSTRESITNWL